MIGSAAGRRPQADGATAEPIGGRRLPPRVSPLAVLPVLLRTRRNSLAILTECWRRSGDFVRLPSLAKHPIYLVVHPDHVRHILQSQQVAYEKTETYLTISRVIGTCILTAPRADWLWRRRLLQPSFRPQELVRAEPIIHEALDQTLIRLESVARSNGTVEVVPEMLRLSLRFATGAFFSGSLDPDESDTMCRAVMAVTPHTTRRMKGYPDPPDWLPWPSHRHFLWSMDTIEGLMRRLVAARRSAREAPDDLLTALLAWRHPDTGEPLSEKELRDEIVNLLLTGHETSGVSLAWIWYLLDQAPAVREQLEAELAAVLGGRMPTLQDLPALEYTRMVVMEALRLYPPVWSFSRWPLTDDQIGGYHVAAFSDIFLAPYLTHRHPEFWSDPEQFEPERFSSRSTASLVQQAYFPFGGGPRVCIGSSFAMATILLTVAAIAQRFRLHPAAGRQVQPNPMLLLYPTNLRMAPRLRSATAR